MVDDQQEIRKSAKDYKNNQDFSTAVSLYEKIYHPQCDPWVAWEYAACLKKLSRIDEAIAISKELYIRDKHFTYNNNLLSWLLYEKYFKHPKNQYSSNELDHLHKIALSITTFTNQEEKNSYIITVIQMLKLQKKYGNNPSLKILELLEKLDVEKLSPEAIIYEQNGRKQEYESQKELFYSMKTKALLETKKYDECISCCNEALLKIQNFHHDNKTWIISRKAVCISQKGNVDEAIIELKEAIIVKKHWSLFEKIAEIYLMKNDSQNALLYFSMAAITNDPPKMKVTLYMNMATFLYSIGEYEKAWMHLCFSKEVREKENWNIPLTMKELYKKLSSNKFSEKVSLQELKNYWISVIYEKLGAHYGIIDRVNATGKAGFIISENKSYFFKASSFIKQPNFKVHDKVKFTLVESFDTKKQCKSLECDYIQIDK